MGVRTPDIIWNALNNLHGRLGLSFREIANTEPFTGMPPGTLNTMWKRHDMPYKWAAKFGFLAELPVRVCPIHGVVHKYDCQEQKVVKKRKPREYTTIQSMPPEVLLWKLENREVIK